MPHFEHIKPPDAYAQGQGHTHRMEMKENGQRLGFINFEYRNDPFPFYYVSFIFTDQKGRGFGTEIIKQMNAFLDDKKIPGILINAIDEKHPAHDIYEHSGWTPIEGRVGWLGYHLRDNIGKGRLDKTLYTIGEELSQDDKKKREAA